MAETTAEVGIRPAANADADQEERVCQPSAYANIEWEFVRNPDGTDGRPAKMIARVTAQRPCFAIRHVTVSWLLDTASASADPNSFEGLIDEELRPPDNAWRVTREAIGGLEGLDPGLWTWTVYVQFELRDGSSYAEEFDGMFQIPLPVNRGGEVVPPAA